MGTPALQQCSGTGNDCSRAHEPYLVTVAAVLSEARGGGRRQPCPLACGGSNGDGCSCFRSFTGRWRQVPDDGIQVGRIRPAGAQLVACAAQTRKQAPLVGNWEGRRYEVLPPALIPARPGWLALNLRTSEYARKAAQATVP